MEENIKEHIENFKEYFEKPSEEEKKSFVKELIISPKTNPSFISIINLFEFYEGFKELKKNEKKSIIKDFVFEFPKINFLAMGIIISILTFIAVLNITLTKNILIHMIMIMIVLLILIFLRSLYLIKSSRGRIHNYYYNYLKFEVRRYGY